MVYFLRTKTISNIIVLKNNLYKQHKTPQHPAAIYRFPKAAQRLQGVREEERAREKRRHCPFCTQHGSVLLETASQHSKPNQPQEKQVVCERRTSRSHSKTRRCSHLCSRSTAATQRSPCAGSPRPPGGPGQQNTAVSVPAGTTWTFYSILA